MKELMFTYKHEDMFPILEAYSEGNLTLVEAMSKIINKLQLTQTEPLILESHCKKNEEI